MERKDLLLGINTLNEVVYLNLNENGTIRGFDCYMLIDREQSYDQNIYLNQCAWVHDVTFLSNGKEVCLKSGQEFNGEVFSIDSDTLDMIESAYVSEGFFCSACGTFHDSEQYYNLSYVVTNECDVYCKECVDADDLLVELNEVSDVFKAKDLTDVDTKDLVEIDTLFCDSSGFGSANEPALTKSQCEKRIQSLIREHSDKQLFCGLTGIGQFQVYITIFTK